MSRSSTTIYVGNLPGDIREKEVEDLFCKYGPVALIDLKIPPRPPGYAFVEFEEARDAEDAIRGRDGYDFDGHRLRVELAHGGRGHPSSTDRHNSRKSGGPHDGVSREKVYQVLIEGLPHSASCEDLKDHMSPGIDVCFIRFILDDKAGKSAIVNLESEADIRYAILRHDASKFQRQNSPSFSIIKVKEYVSKSRSQIRSRSRGRSGSRSPSWSPSRSRTKRRSPPKKRSRRSRSHSSSRRSPPKKRARHSRSHSRSPPKKRSRRSRSHSRFLSRSRSPAPSHPERVGERQRPSNSPKRRRKSLRRHSPRKSPERRRRSSPKRSLKDRNPRKSPRRQKRSKSPKR